MRLDELTERNGQYYINGNLAGYDEVIVLLQQHNEGLKEEKEKFQTALIYIENESCDKNVNVAFINKTARDVLEY
jgi:hypothetical protein